MRKVSLLFSVILAFFAIIGQVNAIEINIIDKTYDEQTLRLGRTLQSDLDNAEKNGNSYVTKKTVIEPKATPAVKKQYNNDPVYTVDDKKENLTTPNLRDDLDKNEGIIEKNQPAIEPAPVEKKSPPPVSNIKQEIIEPAVEKPAAMPEPIPSPIKAEESLAPSERQPVLLGKMSDDELKQQLGIDESIDIAPPETSVEPQAGDEAIIDDADIVPTAPPKEALPQENFSPSIQ